MSDVWSSDLNSGTNCALHMTSVLMYVTDKLLELREHEFNVASSYNRFLLKLTLTPNKKHKQKNWFDAVLKSTSLVTKMASASMNVVDGVESLLTSVDELKSTVSDLLENGGDLGDLISTAKDAVDTEKDMRADLKSIQESTEYVCSGTTKLLNIIRKEIEKKDAQFQNPSYQPVDGILSVHLESKTVDIVAFVDKVEK